jgi:hypothetical protein
MSTRSRLSSSRRVQRVALGCLLAAGGCDYNNDGTLPEEPEAGFPVAFVPDATAPSSVLDGGPLGGLDAQVTLDAMTSLDALVSTPNESFDTALPIEESVGALQDILHSAQTNYFSFDAPTAGFYELRTSAHDFSPDVVLKLYDPRRTLIAQNDQGSLWPGDSVDARLVVRLPSAGRYTVAVADESTPADFFTNGSFRVRYYQLSVRALPEGAAGVTYEGTGPVPITQLRTDEGSGYRYVTLLGTLEANTVDSFTLSAPSGQALIGHLLAGGTLGNGSRSNPGSVRLTDSQARLLAEIDGTLGHLQLFPPLVGGDYVLTASAPPEIEGNAYYALDLVLLPDNPREQHEADNGALSGAEPVLLEGASRRRGLLLSEVPGGDVDYYSFSGLRAERAQVSCEGEAAGSGVRMLRAELRDAADKLLVTALESAVHDLDIASFTLPADGRYYLRLSSDHVLREGEAAPWVRCVVLVGP